MNTLMHFNPFGDIARFEPYAEMDNVFDRFMRSALYPGWREMDAIEPHIRMDVKDVGDEYVVTAEIPGVSKDDIHVSMDGKMITISAELGNEKETMGTLLRSERCHGKTTRTFWLEQEVSEEGAQARYADGVLELRLPRKHLAAHKELAIS